MEQLFKTILCPIDFDENSVAGLEAAVKVAKHNQARLHILHVDPIPLAGEVGVPMEPYLASRKETERLARVHVGEAVPYEIHLENGVPAESILRLAMSLKAELIVLATHGRKGLSRLVLGSVAERVVREAPCPVLSVPGAPKHTTG